MNYLKISYRSLKSQEIKLKTNKNDEVYLYSCIIIKVIYIELYYIIRREITFATNYI